MIVKSGDTGGGVFPSFPPPPPKINLGLMINFMEYMVTTHEYICRKPQTHDQPSTKYLVFLLNH